GNGKTALAMAVAEVLPGRIYIPYTVSTDGQIIKVFDLNNHRPVAAPEGDEPRPGGLRTRARYDRRWALIKRPFIVVGGELLLASLDLVYDPVAKTHEAPYQLKANGGIFLIDDFGRQQVRPRDLLNRWIMPLERRVDFLTLNTGKKIELPFDVLIMFSTNLAPRELVDEAFLRRIPHKIEIPDPGFDEYREIFKRTCERLRIAYDEKMLAYLLQEYYVKLKQPLRAVHPRDILQHLSDSARFRRVSPELRKDLIDDACRAYFLRY
ncbi:MAG: ATP-binding protein, partial [Chloroflexi bacterium]|nr:ATP-binding protein [Chloroflexota bacterium]